MRKISSFQKFVELPQGTYGVFVPHHWGLDRGNLADFSKFKAWDIERRCKWFTLHSPSSGQTYRIGTLVGPFADNRSAQSALVDIKRHVEGTDNFSFNSSVISPISPDNPFVISSNERSNYTTVFPEDRAATEY